MNVLFINEVCGTGSTGKITCKLAEQYEHEGHTVRVAFGRHPYVPEKYRRFAVRIGSSFDVYVHALMSRLTDRHGFYSRRATRRFLQWADEFNPSLLWLHNLHGYFINVEQLFTWIKSRPSMRVLWTLHDCWSFTGHCAYFTMAGCEKWRTMCEHCPQKRAYPASFVDGSSRNYLAKRRLFTGVKDLTLITPSKWLAELTRNSFLKDYPVEVRYNTIDTTIFQPTPSDFRQRFGLEGKIIVLGVASIWEKRKGLDDFVRLSEILDPQRFAIVLVGVTQKQTAALPKSITAITRTNNQRELAEIYTASDVLFTPSYEENYPTVNLEAEACGTPVITYDAGGSPETLHDERSVVVRCGDVEAVKRILVTKNGRPCA